MTSSTLIPSQRPHIQHVNLGHTHNSVHTTIQAALDLQEAQMLNFTTEKGQKEVPSPYSDVHITGNPRGKSFIFTLSIMYLTEL